MKKILLIGNGAREHVIAETLKRSRHEIELFVLGKTVNPGIRELAEHYIVGDICDKAIVEEIVKVNGDFDFAIIGPEAPIEVGMVDMLESMGVGCASPVAQLGMLETSKGFTRNLLDKYQIEGNPLFKVFENEDGLEEFFERLGENFVVKADGLAGGKGVKVSGDHLNGMSEGLSCAREFLAEAGKVVVEEKLVGQEFSLMSFCDGEKTMEMPCVQDHKRAYDGDTGPNTGGMGTYSMPDHGMPFLSKADIAAAAEITRKVASALREECGRGFKGVMYGGFFAVKDGVRLIEYNARFGDPEAMNVLPLLKTDFVDLCESLIAGELIEPEFENKATICRYVVPEGYPDNPCKGEKVVVGELPDGVKVYYSAVDARDGNLYMSGSRAVALVGIGDTLEEAEKLVSKATMAVSGPVFYRKDIGTESSLREKIEMMKRIRS